MYDLKKAYHFGTVIGFLLLCGFGSIFGANPVVTVAGFDDRTIIQRVSGKGNFATNGSYTGSPTAIEVRVVKAEGNQEVVGWKNATLVTASKKWNATLTGIPQGGFYRIQARYRGQTTTPTASANTFGVGVIILMTGQSNLDGFCRANAYTKTPIVPHPLTAHAKLYAYKWYVPETVPDSATAVVLMANNIAKALNLPVGVINICAGASTIGEWLGDYTRTGRNLPGNLRKALKVCALGDLEVMIYHQGWADFSVTTPGATITPDNMKALVSDKGWDEFEQMVADKKSGPLPYQTKLNRLFAQAAKGIKRSDFHMLCGIEGRSFSGTHVENKGVIGTVTKPQGDWSLATSRQVDCVRWAQMAWLKDHPNAAPLGNTIDLRLRDTGHFRKRDRFIIASRYAQSVLHAIGEAPYGGGGPSLVPEECGFSDGGIFLKIRHEGGSKLVVPFPGKPIEGFVVRVPGQKDPLPIKKITIQQPDRIFLELVNKPKGSLLVTYLTGPAPISEYQGAGKKPLEADVDLALGNNLYDNAALPDGNLRSGVMVNGSLGCIRVSKTIGIAGTSPSRAAHMVLHVPELIKSPSVRIGYSLEKESHVILRLYDSQGRVAMQMVDGIQSNGIHWGRQTIGTLPSGFYAAVLKAGAITATRKTIICR